MRDQGEQEVGVRCIAVPVAGPHGPVALSVSGPDSRMGEAAVERMAPIVVAAGARLRAVLTS